MILANFIDYELYLAGNVSLILITSNPPYTRITYELLMHDVPLSFFLNMDMMLIKLRL